VRNILLLRIIGVIDSFIEALVEEEDSVVSNFKPKAQP
jgi:hypothetical protein